MRLLAVDVGHTNLALCLVRVDDDLTLDVEFVKRIDISLIKCGVECQLPHGGHSSYRMMHLFQAYADVFAKADMILVEQ